MYLYDHLGNTRVVYQPHIVPRPGTGELDAHALIESVIDYTPYGKILREYEDGDLERYVTTQHERDVRTGLDYRGARYYDADMGRILEASESNVFVLELLATLYKNL